jgi:hypothetical protein
MKGRVGSVQSGSPEPQPQSHTYSSKNPDGFQSHVAGVVGKPTPTDEHPALP